MAKKIETTEKIEREYIIPLRKEIDKVAIYRRTEKAIKAIKEFVVRHMKIRDRDLKKVKIDKYLNEAMWTRGIKNPVHKIKVKVIKEGEIVRVEAVDLPKNLKFKKLREEKIKKGAEEISKKKKAEKKASEEPEKKPEEKPEEEKKVEDEKKASVVEAGNEMEKAAAKQMKHQVGGKTKEPKHEHRMSLQK
ncbi:MAG: 50S ribosomal protein L31e [Nanoarchaeota archaeon]